MKILAFGDIFGRPGREVISYVAPKWKKEFSLDLVLANGENLSHGRGINETAVRQMLDAGVDVITGGNHTPEGKNARELIANPALPLIRPINFAPLSPGRGFLRVNTKSGEVLIVNAIAQSHMRMHYDSPYRAIETVLSDNNASERTQVIVIDWHADTTSEKAGLGWWLDGKVSLVYGTHTHTPTADERILPQGTGLISDVGMTGAYNSIIGEDVAKRLSILVQQEPAKPDVASAPPYIVNAILAEVDSKTGKCIALQRLQEIITENLSTEKSA